MRTTICFDFGNTRKKAAIFNGSLIAQVLTLEDDATGTVLSLMNTYKPSNSILSSVINHNPEIESILKSNTRFHLLNNQSKLPFVAPVSKPDTIGADRLALVAGGIHLFPNSNLLLIALGTCITTNFVNKYHEFLGGSISPGLEMRLKSLQHYTAALPYIAPNADVPLTGYDTETNILSGVILGMAHELDGFIDDYSAKYANFNVVLTGGDVQHLASHIKNRIFADPELIFKGLYAISELNNA
ncbi:MAG TPA: type III pantothenate kinase [Niabella sp.]|nr:type III pantothenate kinase [Niabella sp.]HOZ96490.1 type III pantothenate kinase [Niabella sp.]HQW13329.1 type III pantothenate kinase [Niabella sp.]HQX18631.1 type III pantothenate kinase [Niabella sp.]HQX40284.1 type III pantothenate kinase [Niabella sp.]